LKKREKYVGPRPDSNSISYKIFEYLKTGVSSRDELAVKLYDYFTNNNITHNSKNRDITLSKIENNIKEILRYLWNSRPGWYSRYKFVEGIDGMKIVKKEKDGNKKT